MIQETFEVCWTLWTVTKEGHRRKPFQLTLSFLFHDMRDIDDASAHTWLGIKLFLIPAGKMTLHNGLLSPCMQVTCMLKSLSFTSDIYILLYCYSCNEKLYSRILARSFFYKRVLKINFHGRLWFGRIKILQFSSVQQTEYPP